MSSIGIGLIGTGYMGKCHALAWNAVGPTFGDGPQVRLVHLAEVDQQLARDKARAFGFEKATGNWRDLIADPEVDVISIAAPNAFHPEMAIEALHAGKHIWCEKPMAPKFKDALKMREAARSAGRTAVLGYNYIQNPMIREIANLLDEGAIGEVNHIRIEMDEDFMADPDQFFYWKSEASSGYGALDDFAVHPLSLIRVLFGRLASVTTDMAKPYAERPLKTGGKRAVETHDIASVLFRMESGASGVLMANRAAWGRKGRIAIQIFGSAGSIAYDQERMNEVELYRANGPAREAGYTRILAGPAHPPYDSFIPAPGHGLGFNDLKVIECHHLIAAIEGRDAHVIDFEKGVEIERAVHAMAAAHERRGWVDIDYD
ncbi:Gfo/Idh/MocA family protein [Martelella limonii]|uniref:Gfo/Idh/MocA family protein n=1 Tax=Martelella limonii TaxID=1647649 RepID=UPI001580439F|nr:Gfo/Idh/MocA family oxidoreductase [Martelella limonii]